MFLDRDSLVSLDCLVLITNVVANRFYCLICYLDGLKNSFISTVKGELKALKSADLRRKAGAEGMRDFDETARMRLLAPTWMCVVTVIFFILLAETCAPAALTCARYCGPVELFFQTELKVCLQTACCVVSYQFSSQQSRQLKRYLVSR